MGAPKITPEHEEPLFSAHDDDDEHPPKKVEEGEGPWLVSYADLMTLLMGFFALVSSFSTPNPEKFDAMKETAAETFGGDYEKPYKELKEALEKFVAENKLKDQVKLKVDATGVEMTFTGTLFFDSGNFVVKKEASDLMVKLAKEIKNVPHNYSALVEGHTDSAPIRHPIIASNWELSGLRAARIAQLLETNGFARDSLTIIGWGENKLVAPDFDSKGQKIEANMAKNRRIVIKVFDKKVSKDPVSR